MFFKKLTQIEKIKDIIKTKTVIINNLPAPEACFVSY